MKWMSHHPEDRFSPPGTSGAGDAREPELALGREVRRAPAPVAGDPAEPPLPASPRQPVAYKKPPGGIGNFVIWIFAAVGLGAAVLFGAGVLKRGVEGSRAAPSGAATIGAAPSRAAEPARPVTWKPVQTGDAVLVTVEVTPRSARLLLDGAPMPSNPARLDSGTSHTITAMAPGFETATAEVAAKEATTIRLRLKKAR
jgi:hypothetical protein